MTLTFSPLPQGEEITRACLAVMEVGALIVIPDSRFDFSIASLQVCRDFQPSPGKLPGTPRELI